MQNPCCIYIKRWTALRTFTSFAHQEKGDGSLHRLFPKGNTFMKTKLDAKLGRPDSNWRLQESKSCALPLGDGPKFHAAGNPVHMFSCLVRRKKSFASKRLEGGYRDSNPGPPEPQSGALTNCAIPTIKRARRDSNPRPTA